MGNLSQAAKRQRAKALANSYGIKVADTPVCEGHIDPLTFVTEAIFDRPSQSLWHGPRGGGKSYLRAFCTHVDSLQYDSHHTKILGGSEAQSKQIFEAIKRLGSVRFEEEDIEPDVLATRAVYSTGSEVSFIPASAKSVRGPHIPSLCLDEVDEIEPDVREAAVGMCMDVSGVSASLTMTSTWHRVAGPMAELIEKGKSGAFPVHTFCVFETLERCPDSRSGERLENCPQCPLMKWCHADRDRRPDKLPKAKRSNGHYTIASLIQKVNALSERVLESDFFCTRPKASEVWFTTFDENVHVSYAAEYNPNYPVHLSIDPGVETGAVWFQLIPDSKCGTKVSVFADYYGLDLGAEKSGLEIREQSTSLCGIGMVGGFRVSMDTAGNSKTALGPTVRGEYERIGLRGRNGLEVWPQRGKKDGLTFIEALLRSADGTVSFQVHPRCKRLVRAFQSYVRAVRDNQLMDYAKDPQHPHEDLIDPLAGALKLEYPEGRTPPPRLRQIHGSLI
jgi:hypothetical protein